MKVHCGTFNTSDLVTIRARITQTFHPATPLSEQLQSMASAQALILHLSPDDQVSEFDMRQQFKANISGLSNDDQVQLCRLYEWYELSEPEHGKLTFKGLKDLLNKRFHPSTTNATISSLGLVHSALGVVPRMYTQAEMDAVLTSKSSASAVSASTPSAPAAKSNKFCFLHGVNESHTGEYCRVLKKSGSTAMKKATRPGTVGAYTSTKAGLDSAQRSALREENKIA
jgi:hypothetical protein